MANNLTGLNVSTGAGEGQANILQWGNVDKLRDQLYNEQKARQLRAQQEYQMNNALLEKEFANVRSADIPELRTLYNQRKALSQRLTFDPRLAKDVNAYSAAERQLNDADLALRKGIKSSIETKDFDKGLNEDLYKNRDLYRDDAGTMFQQISQIPTSQRIANGYNTAEPFLYQGTQKGFVDLDKKARGEQKAIYGATTRTKDNLYDETPTYNAYNDAGAYKDIFHSGLADRSLGRDAAHEASKLTPEQYNSMKQAYDNIPESEYAKFGKTKPDLTPKNFDDKADLFSSYKAMEYALNNLPEKGKTERVENKAEFDKIAKQTALDLIAARQKGQEALLKKRHEYAKLDKKEQGLVLDAMIDKQFEEGKKQGATTYKTKDGKEVTEYQLKVSPRTKEIFSITNSLGKKVYPDAVRITANGDVRPIFFEKDENGQIKSVKGKAAVLTNLSQPISRDEYKARLGQQLLSDKGLSAELEGEFGGDAEDEDLGFEWK